MTTTPHIRTLVPTVVLYDIMCEAATRVQGTLIHLQRSADLATHEDYLQARLAIADRVALVDVDDRDAIQVMTVVLREEFDRLNAA